MGHARIDRQTAVRVEKGLLVQSSSCTRDAAVYMASRNVPLHVALRVLTTPHRRDMHALGAFPPEWRGIMADAGPTYGAPTDFGLRN